MSTGRNDPCACGSGRKYKHCCLAGDETTDARWVAWRRAEGHVVDGVTAMMKDVWGAELMNEALTTFFLDSPPPADAHDAERWGQLFMPWLAFDFVPEARRTRKGQPQWPTKPLAEELAARYGERLTPTDLRFVAAACDAPMSFMAITAVQPGRSVDLKDILTGETHHVLERSASTAMRPGQLLLARVVADGDVAIMSGCGPYPLMPGDHNRIIDFRELFLRKRGSVDRVHLKASWFEMLALYRQLVDLMLNPPPPQLQNTDGDPLAPTTLVFELRCSVREALDRLKVLSLDRADDHLLADATWSDTGDLAEVCITWNKRGNKLHRHWDNTTLGTVTISPGEISVFVNSAKRAKKIRSLIEKHLGADVLFLRHTVESVEAMLDPARRDAKHGAAGQEPDTFRDSPEAQAFIEEMNRRHWEGWLDGKVPALGNVTPREAARTSLGRERLEALLAEYAWRQNDGPGNQIRVDVDWIRTQLGLKTHA